MTSPEPFRVTPDEIKESLATHIKLLESQIARVEDTAHTLGRYFGVYELGDSQDVYEIRRLLRELQEQLVTDPGKAEFLANVRTLDARGEFR